MKTTTQSLTADEILDKILSSKGQFVKAVWKSNPSPAAAHKKAGVLLEKHTSAVCRAGINFAQLSAVKDAIAANERGEVQELPFGTWLHFPYIIKHTPKGSEDEQYYVRLYPTDSRCETIYFVNGEKVDKDTFTSYLTPSEAAKLSSGEKPLCFTIKRENILATEDFGG
jgi:hypothetical protein